MPGSCRKGKINSLVDLDHNPLVKFLGTITHFRYTFASPTPDNRQTHPKAQACSNVAGFHKLIATGLMKMKSLFSPPSAEPRFKISFRKIVLTCVALMSLVTALVVLRRTRASDHVARGHRPEKLKLAQNYGAMPISFERRNGPGDAAQFVGRGAGYVITLTSTGPVMSLRQHLGAGTEETQPARVDLAMSLRGARSNLSPQGWDELPGKVNYLLGNDPQTWRTAIDTYSQVFYSQVYPGIDLIYYGNQKQLEYDFRLKAGADPRRIRLEFHGARHLKLDQNGNLTVAIDGGELKLLKPSSYQQVEGARKNIETNFTITGKDGVAFSLSPYDRKLPLVIDPVLSYSTYLGGLSDDQAFGIAVDANGDAYITGETLSPEFPSTSNAKSGSNDVFVTKINPAGNAILYSTFLGGNGFDQGNAIAIDAAGNAFVAGQTSSSDFPLVNPMHSTFGGVSDAFVAELNSAGSAIAFSTYLGGSSFDAANSIALDTAGNVYVTGEADSRDFPVVNAFQSSKVGRFIFKTTDGAANWAASDTGAMAAFANSISFSPGNGSIVFAGCDSGIFKSIDAGNTWSALGAGQIPFGIQNVTVDPSNAQTIYAGTSVGLYKVIIYLTTPPLFG